MTPKEKAKKLFESFYKANQPETFDLKPAKQCALIAVDEIINAITPLVPKIQVIWFWQEVRLELEKL